jgi:DNA-directed RNA polymerase specialized sigma24 family protein
VTSSTSFQTVTRLLVRWTQGDNCALERLLPLVYDGLRTSANILENQTSDLIALDDALIELSRLDERQARTVDLRFFAGLSVADTAQAMDISPATVNRSWMAARLWLYRESNRGAQR